MISTETRLVLNNPGVKALSFDESGLSLIEVIISLVVLGVVLVALGQGLTLGIRMNTESKTRITNLSLAKQVTEKMKSDMQISQADFDGATANNSFNRTYYVDTYGNEFAGEQKDNADFEVTTRVTDWTDNTGNPLTAPTPGGGSAVLVKTLDVVILARQSAVVSNKAGNAAGSSREVKMRVEVVRPAS